MIMGIASVALLLVIWFIIMYNRFVRLRNMMKQAWSDIDVQLKRRHDLVPKLVTVVKAYAAHEKTTLEQVTEKRNRCLSTEQIEDRGHAEMQLQAGIRQLFALAESYPDLKANQNFLDLQNDISDVEDTIQMARRYYNGAVKLYNIQVESFPSLLVAHMFNYTLEPYFELDPGDDSLPEINFSTGEAQ